MPSMDQRLIQWLRDAHAMEMQAETMLSTQASRLEHYPELRERIELHITETRHQASRIAGCLRALDSEGSAVRNLVGKFAAELQSLGGAFAADEVVKGAMAGYVFEHAEIASYTVLIAAAEAFGALDVARVCRENRGEEEAMAQWLNDHLAAISRAFLGREQADEPAKR